MAACFPGVVHTPHKPLQLQMQRLRQNYVCDPRETSSVSLGETFGRLRDLSSRCLLAATAEKALLLLPGMAACVPLLPLSQLLLLLLLQWLLLSESHSCRKGAQ
jgi:hypothetical protein